MTITKTWVNLWQACRTPETIASHSLDFEGNVVPMSEAQIASAVTKARQCAEAGARIEVNTVTYEQGSEDVTSTSVWYDA